MKNHILAILIALAPALYGDLKGLAAKLIARYKDWRRHPPALPAPPNPEAVDKTRPPEAHR